MANKILLMYLCGIDEAGRGPLAGPVVAASVILPNKFPNNILNDSKKLTREKRKHAVEIIKSLCIDYGVGWVWPEEIDRYNIHFATLLAMKRAYSALTIKPDLVLIDGLFAPPINASVQVHVKGDTYVPSIQAASIIAKTTRDLWMERFSWIYTDYDFDSNMGYPTVQHRRVLEKKGPSPIHRTTYRFTVPR